MIAVYADFIVKMRPAGHLLIGQFLVAVYGAGAADADRGAGTGDKSVFEAGDILAQQRNRLLLALAQFQGTVRVGQRINGVDRRGVFDLDKHQIIITQAGCGGLQSDLRGFFNEILRQFRAQAIQPDDLPDAVGPCCFGNIVQRVVT